MLKNNHRLITFISVFILFIACLAFIGGAVFLWNWTFSPPRAAYPTIDFSSPVVLSTETNAPALATVAPPADSASPAGKIVYVCQIFRSAARDQICIMNPDGSNIRRITSNDNAKHYYPSFSPDGSSVVFSSNLSGEGYEIYEINIDGSNLRQLTDKIGIPNSPAISPDGQQIAFTRGDGVQYVEIWIMERDGSNPRPLYAMPRGQGWDPAWSPDGSKIMFASVVNGSIQLMTINRDGTDPRVLTSMTGLRGRNDWSPDAQWIVTYAGTPWNRELFLMRADGSGLVQLTPSGGNSQGPSFSPYGEWVVFTAYFDNYGEDNGCDIYIIRTDGTDLRRLTENNYCDWQPRWGR
jgi:TolB protein